MIEDRGEPPTVGKKVDAANLRHPIASIWMIDDGVYHEWTVKEAKQLALDLWATATGHDPTDPWRIPVEPLTTEELERVDKELAVSPSPWEPKAAERAHAVELYQERVRVDGTPQTWQRALINYSRAVNQQQNAPASVTALVDYGLYSGFFTDYERDADIMRAKIAHDLAVEQEIARTDWEAELE